MTLLFQIVGLSLLLAGLALGYGRWIKPHASVLDWQGKGLLLLVVLTLAGGFIGSPFWWMDEARSFSWDLPPLASRMLASAGWSFVVVCWLVLERPTDRRLRLVLLLLFVYLSPLALAAPLFHLDRFDPAAPITSGTSCASPAFFQMQQPICPRPLHPCAGGWGLWQSSRPCGVWPC